MSTSSGSRVAFVACLFGALAVILGAFGAHALKERVSEQALGWWHTGVQYHVYHVLATLWLACWTRASGPRSAWAGRASVAFFVGIIIFSGSLYTMTLTGQTWLGRVVPIGGVLFILGWVFAALAVRADTTEDAT